MLAASSRGRKPVRGRTVDQTAAPRELLLPPSLREWLPPPPKASPSLPPLKVLLDEHESVAGSQYTSFAFQHVLDDHHVFGSIGSVGDAYDNALAESFVDTFKTELIADRVWRTRTHLEL
jgi:hypothetical protein